MNICGERVFDDVSSLGWVSSPSPVTPLFSLADHYGAEFVGVKRDDQIAFGSGGSKIRKLDFLLASEPFRDAKGWHGLGAIGSGNSVALAEAASALDKTFYAHCFWEPVCRGTLENLARICSGPSEVRYYSGRIAMGLANPSLLIRKRYQGLPVIPPGSTTPLAMFGMVRAGLELAEQVRQGELPCPDCIYVSIGTGGTAIGLSVGLGLAKLPTKICAVSAVERILCNQSLVRRTTRSLLRVLREIGIESTVAPVSLSVDHREIGAGYGHPTARSLAMCRLMDQQESEHERIVLEPVYTGKALSRMVKDLEQGRTNTPLLWNTARRTTAAPESDWHEKLPETLHKRLSLVSEEFRRQVLGGSLRDR